MPWVHVRGQRPGAWPKASRVESWFGSGSSGQGEALSPSARSRVAFLRAWRANTTALLLSVSHRLSSSRVGSAGRKLVVWQNSPLLPEFFSASVSRFMQHLNSAGRSAVADANAQLAQPKAQLGHLNETNGLVLGARQAECTVRYFDAEALMSIGRERRWWGGNASYAMCCQDGYGHMRPMLMRALYLNLLRWLSGEQGQRTRVHGRLSTLQ